MSRLLSPVTRGLLSLVLLLVAACGAGPTASFDPSSPCGGVDLQRAAGAYPALEARLPRSVTGKAAQTVDSGRYCSAKTLGTLVGHGIHEVRFAGAVFPASDGQAGLSTVVFVADGLTAAWMADSYEAGARADSRTTGVRRSSLTMDGRPGFRIDALRATDTSSTGEAVIVWPSADGQAVQVVIGAGVTEAALDAATAAFGA
ncbi:MAG TPA: hypothetical protein VF763_03995 [Candidatus Limnocylindrales bacterium]